MPRLDMLTIVRMAARIATRFGELILPPPSTPSGNSGLDEKDYPFFFRKNKQNVLKRPQSVPRDIIEHE